MKQAITLAGSKTEPPAIDVPISSRGDGIGDGTEPGQHGNGAARAALVGGIVQRRQLDDGPDEPHQQGGEHGTAQRSPVPHNEWRERRAEIDEGGSECEYGREHESDRIRDLEPRIFVFEEDPRCPDRVQAEEAARGQEGKRDQEHTRVAPTVCRLAGSVGEHENADAHCQEEAEMDGVVRPIQIELVTQQERDEADKRQRCRQDPHRAC